MSHTSRILQAISIALFPLVAACAGPPKVNGVAGASPSPSVPWTPPAGVVKPEPLVTTTLIDVVPADLKDRIRQLTLADVVDLALRNNPATRASWFQARAAADLYGSARGDLFPTLNCAGAAVACSERAVKHVTRG